MRNSIDNLHGQHISIYPRRILNHPPYPEIFHQTAHASTLSRRHPGSYSHTVFKLEKEQKWQQHQQAKLRQHVRQYLWRRIRRPGRRRHPCRRWRLLHVSMPPRVTSITGSAQTWSKSGALHELRVPYTRTTGCRARRGRIKPLALRKRWRSHVQRNRRCHSDRVYVRDHDGRFEI
ncbi:uncharacterized protein B0I36DRAFT_163846 [Microdochium trichocladiopsis]|uniref:Uncharacterized protein n=1 Tax=Microdochium trichocladiopsis TaxID=1682393 RepID=A0A9P8XXM1_9PEZI|nr:uncharacterized protein B0I36DRAFT_163846 [Microdochium trichocladiopsis]KAH7024706.1 hypothetical protein B0I36DRAFT_163846 [Microdochium trichocladiopsis]